MIKKFGLSSEPTREVTKPELQPLEAEVTVEEEVTTEVVADVSPVETVEALEGAEAEEAKKVKVSGTKMEVAPMKPEVTEVEEVTKEIKEEAPKGRRLAGLSE